MKTLWAPWRMDYILNDVKEKGCIFCPGENGNFSERLILFRGNRSLVMMNKYPYINGHLLVAPLRHVAAPDQLEPQEMIALMTMVSHSVTILKKTMKAEGFNVGLNLGKVAGAGVEDHLHFHIVPRWNGDTNFMTVFGDLRVIPEHMEQTYFRLLPFFKEVQEGFHENR
ncbi:MAG: HIT domain-containing protein [Deltaproteobacteria bacterium]|nr:HIT domain-containing protein [Deltaproteobacteria bacterium]